MTEDAGTASRRAVLAGTGAAGVTAVLTGCQTYGVATPAPAAPVAPAATGTAGPTAAAGDGGAAEPAAAPALARLADIPVGGGRIFAEQGVVLTQPTAGTVKAFSAKCTHAGCTVTSVADGTIVCACHNSRFDITDGSVRGGPAGSPLPAAAVTVDGDAVRLT
ncbi:Rieske (2Fe-2S) protein [Micromonospora thermarum]|uniref:Cytochrome bc1 complex Rieske iron-sulfur subunit n=1 Tax=Micromonospora thermarum TaxID=2720024 RepID=A0ABX0Z731_9ACTN|nr:Rieske (2Fe-2S) protein [Micromonospora thermarum]NJP33655.1 Rieske (2Fe-2S) protein [Micromonospora thermarum]